jgi:hypothetical protein
VSPAGRQADARFDLYADSEGNCVPMCSGEVTISERCSPPLLRPERLRCPKKQPKGSSGINRSGRSSKREHTTRPDRRTRFGYFLPCPNVPGGRALCHNERLPIGTRGRQPMRSATTVAHRVRTASRLTRIGPRANRLMDREIIWQSMSVGKVSS